MQARAELVEALGALVDPVAEKVPAVRAHAESVEGEVLKLEAALEAASAFVTCREEAKLEEDAELPHRESVVQVPPLPPLPFLVPPLGGG